MIYSRIVQELADPRSYKESKSRFYHKDWNKAMEEDIRAIEQKKYLDYF